jgi:hypothetical protein
MEVLGDKHAPVNSAIKHTQVSETSCPTAIYDEEPSWEAQSSTPNGQFSFTVLTHRTLWWTMFFKKCVSAIPDTGIFITFINISKSSASYTRMALRHTTQRILLLLVTRNSSRWLYCNEAGTQCDRERERQRPCCQYEIWMLSYRPSPLSSSEINMKERTGRAS